MRSRQIDVKFESVFAFHCFVWEGGAEIVREGMG